MDKAVLSPGDFTAFQSFLEAASGIRLTAGKEYLVTSRLGGLMRHYGIGSIGELLDHLESGRQVGLQNEVIDAMTTNETFWFRDISHYHLLTKRLFPEHAASNKQDLSIWSAACSSGQEPYNISMMVQDYQSYHPRELLRDTQIVATDISPGALAKAKRGAYCGMAATRGLNRDQQRRYFVPQGDCLKVREEIKARVRFKELNLLKEFQPLGKFDIIFCRNVLIYFSSDRKRQILSRMAAALKPNGYLFLGSTESLSTHSDRFEMIKGEGGIVYRVI
ncbi:MAG: protein-glutamate O-methyltransferase CheR [Candidatus Sedimenticola sp. (ex Thyasira tokunagai)]